MSHMVEGGIVNFYVEGDWRVKQYNYTIEYECSPDQSSGVNSNFPVFLVLVNYILNRNVSKVQPGLLYRYK